MKERKHRLGIMGGTFDPIHNAHLVLAQRCLETFDLERVLFIPAGNPPHKRARTDLATDAQRTEMVRLAIRDNPRFELELSEMEKESYSYSYETLTELTERHPDTEYYFIIGADSLFSFESWKKPERICELAVLAVADRGERGEELRAEMERLHDRYGGDFRLMEVPRLDISSTELRSWAAKGRSLRYFCPDAVCAYIREMGLYR